MTILRQQRDRERGAALLLFLLVLVVLSASQLLRNLNHQGGLDAVGDDAEVSRKVLLEAKQALLGYAAAFAAQNAVGRGPGHLPCPAEQNDHDPETSCGGGATVSVGLLPEMGTAAIQALPPFLDGSGNPLIYVLDWRFRYNPYEQVNTDTAPSLTLAGAGVVALLYAPGPVRAGQTRDAVNINLGDYLEDGANTDGDSDFVTPTELGNDAVIAITQQEILCTIRRVVRAGEALDPDPAWYATEGWDAARLATLNALGCALGGS
jgi:hypothetical protein